MALSRTRQASATVVPMLAHGSTSTRFSCDAPAVVRLSDHPLAMSAPTPLQLSTVSANPDRDQAPSRVVVTVVVPTLNEAAQIVDALTDLTWADEVIVVDGGSTDETVALAEATGARVLTVRDQTIAAQRNAGIAAARNEWILALDADERVTPELRGEIDRVVAGHGDRRAAYKVKFQNYYLGRELHHGPWGRDWHVRLFTRERRYVCDRVHEHLEPIADVGSLGGTIMHTPYRDLSHHVAKIVRYASWGADDMLARGRRADFWQLMARPAWRFGRDYVLLSGWRDGVVGFIAAVLSAFAAFLKYAFLFTRGQSAKR